jgi:hypothetical protein
VTVPLKKGKNGRPTGGNNCSDRDCSEFFGNKKCCQLVTLTLNFFQF